MISRLLCFAVLVAGPAVPIGPPRGVEVAFVEEIPGSSWGAAKYQHFLLRAIRFDSLSGLVRAHCKFADWICSSRIAPCCQIVRNMLPIWCESGIFPQSKSNTCAPRLATNSARSLVALWIAQYVASSQRIFCRIAAFAVRRTPAAAVRTWGCVWESRRWPTPR